MRNGRALKRFEMESSPLYVPNSWDAPSISPTFYLIIYFKLTQENLKKYVPHHMPIRRWLSRFDKIFPSMKILCFF
jgi:hypothetical protein